MEGRQFMIEQAAIDNLKRRGWSVEGSKLWMPHARKSEDDVSAAEAEKVDLHSNEHGYEATWRQSRASEKVPMRDYFDLNEAISYLRQFGFKVGGGNIIETAESKPNAMTGDIIKYLRTMYRYDFKAWRKETGI